MVFKKSVKQYRAALAAKGMTALYSKWKAFRSRTRTQYKKKPRSGQGVTGQYDRRQIYQKRYMPRGRKRQWVKFVRKVQAVNSAGLGTRTILFNETITMGVFTSLQSIGMVHLYSYKGQPPGAISQEQGANDISRMAARDGLTSTNKIYFKSAVMDVTFNGYPQDNATAGPLEVDVYEIAYLKKNYLGSLTEMITLSETQTTTATGYTNGIQLIDRGATPFELPLLGRHGIKVMKKTKFFLNPDNSTFTYQMRDPGNKYLSLAQLGTEPDATEFAKGNLTRSLLFVVKLVAGNTAELGDGCICGVTRKYSYVVPALNQVVDGRL